MLVVGVVAGAYEIVTAKPEERARTVAGVAGGFAGGFALGATAGLLCGPGAPVCSFVLGLSLGTLGALGGRAGAEALFDAATAPPAASSSTPGSQSSSTATGAPGTDITAWELMFTPPPEPVDLLFSRATGGTPLVRPATSLDMAFIGGPPQ